MKKSQNWFRGKRIFPCRSTGGVASVVKDGSKAWWQHTPAPSHTHALTERANERACMSHSLSESIPFPADQARQQWAPEWTGLSLAWTLITTSGSLRETHRLTGVLKERGGGTLVNRLKDNSHFFCVISSAQLFVSSVRDCWFGEKAERVCWSPSLLFFLSLSASLSLNVSGRWVWGEWLKEWG